MHLNSPSKYDCHELNIGYFDGINMMITKQQQKKRQRTRMMFVLDKSYQSMTQRVMRTCHFDILFRGYVIIYLLVFNPSSEIFFGI